MREILSASLRLCERFAQYIRGVIVQAAHIGGMSGKQYDNYLEAGWFRGSSMMYRSEFVCLDRQLYSIVNIRFSLKDLHYGKSLRKILRKNDALFRVTVGVPMLTEEKERMYFHHKNRYKAFLHGSLSEIVYGYVNHLRINTRELCVYSGDRLIAVSYFDLGENTIAGIIGIYDPAFAAYSLGHYTMMKEMMWAAQANKLWYYPGYVMDVPTAFDYKHRLGKAEWLNDEKKWEPWSTYCAELSQANVLRSKMLVLADYLREKGIVFKEKLYPYFTTGHLVDRHNELFKYPVFLDIQDKEYRYAATYDIEKNIFLMFQIEPTSHYDVYLDLEISDEYKRSDIYEMSMLKVYSVTPFFIGTHHEKIDLFGRHFL